MPWFERKTCRVIEPATPLTFLGSEAPVLTGVLTSTNGLTNISLTSKATVEELGEPGESIEPNKRTGLHEVDILIFNICILIVLKISSNYNTTRSKRLK